MVTLPSECCRFESAHHFFQSFFSILFGEPTFRLIVCCCNFQREIFHNILNHLFPRCLRRFNLGQFMSLVVVEPTLIIVWATKMLSFDWNYITNLLVHVLMISRGNEYIIYFIISNKYLCFVFLHSTQQKEELWLRFYVI